MEAEKYLYSDLTRRVIGCAMEVHNTLGVGFQEVIYQRALAMEMTQAALEFSREHEMKIHYKGVEIGSRRADFFVEDRLMVELKAVTQLEDVHLAQTINYLEVHNIEVGLLLNFGSPRLKYKRLIKPKRAV